MTRITSPYPAHFTLEDSAPLNKLELTSVLALLAYTAHDRKISEGTVKEIVTTHFAVGDVAQLPRQSYDDVIRFLVDMQIDMMIN